VKYQDEVEQGVGLVEDLVDVVEEDSGVLGAVVVVEVSVVEAGVVVLEAGAVEGLEEEVDHRSYNLQTSVSFFRSLVTKSTLGGESWVVTILSHLFLMCNLSADKVSDPTVDPSTLHVYLPLMTGNLIPNGSLPWNDDITCLRAKFEM